MLWPALLGSPAAEPALLKSLPGTRGGGIGCLIDMAEGEAAWSCPELLQILCPADLCSEKGCTCHSLHDSRLCHAETELTCRMGTHPSGPAIVEGAEGESLSSWIAANPSALGSIGPLFGNDIPFLFKVLAHRTPSLV